MTGPAHIRIRLGADGAPVCDGVTRFTSGHVLARADADNPDGVFAEWAWDGETLRARTDRYGLAPLYYAHLADGVMLAPSIADLIALGAPANFDLDALAVLLRFGQLLDEDTPFAAIRALPPSGRLVWQAGVLTVEGHYPEIRPQSLSRDAVIDEFIERFRTTIARRPVTGRLVLPLSGGRDSRHIFLELCRQGRKPDACVTSRGYPDASMEGEAAIAAELCTDLGVPHRVIDAPTDQVDAMVEAIIDTNLGNLEHGWEMTLADLLAAEADTIFDGLGGDVLSAGLFFTDARLDAVARLDAERFANAVFVNDEYSLRLALAPRLYRDLSRERAVARLAKAMPRHLAAANPLSSFYFWTRTRRNIAQVPFGLFRRVKTIYAPYLDWDLFDLFASLGPALTKDKALHTDAIAKAYPEARDIPYAKGWSEIDARTLERRHLGNTGALARRLLRPGSGSLVNRQALLPRMAWHALTGSLGVTVPSYLRLVCYLLALGQVTRGRFSDQRPGGSAMTMIYGLLTPISQAMPACV